MAPAPEPNRWTLWTPAMPRPFFEAFALDDIAAARLLWAAYCVPERYRLAPHRWRQEARVANIASLNAARRRLRAQVLVDDHARVGPGLRFDGQHWRRRTEGPQLTFLSLQPTAEGMAVVRAGLRTATADSGSPLPPPPQRLPEGPHRMSDTLRNGPDRCPNRA